ncbi:MAG TPA: 30S ribosome-binding factor RbfA [Firmicutes bacterium]|nr:30S ribosome-binding factor RbfA [Bacillota bacterium]
MSMRLERLSAAMKEEVSLMIQRELKDPRIGFCSVTRVELSQDLGHAKVFVSVLGEEEDKRRTMEGLKSASGFIRSELTRRLGLYHAPEIMFKLDESIEKGVEIARILNQLKEDRDAGAT